MSQRPKPATTPASTGNGIVPVGSRHVFKNAAANSAQGILKQRPTTTKALVLRNGKYGAMGTGEMVVASKLGGREKLDLLAEDYAKKSTSAVRNPFRLEQCVRIAESQLNAYLDEISCLEDPELFHVKIMGEAQARLPFSNNPTVPNLLKNPSFIASVVSNRVHNMYMLASAWNLVREALFELIRVGADNLLIETQLQNNENIRSYFLVLHDIVNILVDACQANFAILATTTPHYAEYFKQTDDIDEPEVSFDWASLKSMHKSFLDSIIVELCLPNSLVSKPILLHILNEAVEEAPREAKRFPQALWDAVGDYAVTVQLQDILEGPLLGCKGQTLKALSRMMPEEFELWIDAQLFSNRASKKYANFKDAIYPLEKTRNQEVLQTLWRCINLNYESVSGMDIDHLWNLTEVRDQTPQWHAFYIPGLYVKEPLLRDDGGKKRLALTTGDPEDSDDSMPSLQTVSDTSEVDDFNVESESDVYFDYASPREDDQETEWDTDEEEEIKDLIREAMDVAMSTPDFTYSKAPVPEFDALAEERKDNPFLKLLGSLRGRFFSCDPNLKTTNRDQPRRPYADVGTTKPKSTTSRSMMTTVEEVVDEDDFSSLKKKKKKKKKPKKKKKVPSAASGSSENVIDQATPPMSPMSPTSPGGPQAKGVPSSPQGKAKQVLPPAKNRVPAPNVSAVTLPFESTTSLALPSERSAQSAHAYMQSEGLVVQKPKVKSRPDYGNLLSLPSKQGFFSKFGKRQEPSEEPAEEPAEGATHSWFSRLGRKTTNYMRQLIGADEGKVAPMRWENFLKVMAEMGFECNASVAGSSVRFDPPDPRDRSITFHKPHPDSTLAPHMLKDFGKRLKRYYGWSEADFFEKLDS